jgi:fructose-1,6-bisphosphatase/inositol monophosphatase family enzyme
MTADASILLEPIRMVHELIRERVVECCERVAEEELARVVADGAGDTIYAVDRVSEELLVELFERHVACFAPVVLIAEGVGDGAITLPRGASEEEAAWRIIADPIDGTRGLMYQKRSGWILTGVAPNRGSETCLADIQLAVQTEIPLVKQHLSDVLWAQRGDGAHGERFNRLTNERAPLRFHPSRSVTLDHGFAAVVRFFSGARDLLAAIDDEIVHSATGEVDTGRAVCFEDQYICTGGQLYELIMGHDRFIADLRPLIQETLRSRGWKRGLCCHPYDLSTELIAREAGVSVTNPQGEPLWALLCVDEEVAWVGYANAELQKRIQPVLEAALRDRGLAPDAM